MSRQITKVRLLDAMPLIRDALIRMLDKPYRKLPYVVVMHVLTRRFVQFAGSQTERIIIDVPQLSVSERQREGTPDEVAAKACVIFREDFSLPSSAWLEIEEGDQNAAAN